MTRFITALACFLSLQNCGLSFADSTNEFEVAGKLSFRIGSGFLERHDDVLCSVRGSCWYLKIVEREVKYKGKPTPPGTDFVAASCDGTNIYSVTQISKSTATTSPCNAIIESGPVPYDLDPRIGALWLAFCSASYFNSVTNALLFPIEGFGANKTNFSHDYRVRAAWTRDRHFHLPRNVVYYGEVPSDTSPGKLTFTNVSYEITGTTNVGADSFPSGFLLQKFRLRERNLAQYEQTKFVVTSVAPRTAIQAFTLTLPGKCFVQDKRFYKVSKPEFGLSFYSSEWPDAHKVERFRARARPLSNKMRSRYAVVIFVAFATAPILMYWLSKKNIKETEKERREI